MDQALMLEVTSGGVKLASLQLVTPAPRARRYAAVVDGLTEDVLVEGVSEYLAATAADQFNKLAIEAGISCRAIVVAV